MNPVVTVLNAAIAEAELLQIAFKGKPEAEEMEAVAFGLELVKAEIEAQE